MNILDISTVPELQDSNAMVRIYCKNNSIKNHYCSSMRYIPGNTDVAKPDFFVVGSIKSSSKYCTAFYKLLWVRYLDLHPELVKYLKEFDSIVGTENTVKLEVIREYIADGRDKIMMDENVRLMERIFLNSGGMLI